LGQVPPSSVFGPVFFFRGVVSSYPPQRPARLPPASSHMPPHPGLSGRCFFGLDIFAQAPMCHFSEGFGRTGSSPPLFWLPGASSSLWPGTPGSYFPLGKSRIQLLDPPAQGPPRSKIFRIILPTLLLKPYFEGPPPFPVGTRELVPGVTHPFFFSFPDSTVLRSSRCFPLPLGPIPVSFFLNPSVRIFSLVVGLPDRYPFFHTLAPP